MKNIFYKFTKLIIDKYKKNNLLVNIASIMTGITLLMFAFSFDITMIEFKYFLIFAIIFFLIGIIPMIIRFRKNKN